MPSSRLTRFILLGLVLGVAAGYGCFAFWPQAAPAFAAATELLPTIFLRLIKMIIAPLVFSTLVVGIAKMGDPGTVGRVGLKALGWFLLASLISLSLGLVLVNLFKPGIAMHVPLPDNSAQIPQLCDPHDQRGEHQRRDDHLDQAQKYGR